MSCYGLLGNSSLSLGLSTVSVSELLVSATRLARSAP
jgi:hypothetical protein